MSKTGYLHKIILSVRTNAQKVFSIELQQGVHLYTPIVLLIHSLFISRIKGQLISSLTKYFQN